MSNIVKIHNEHKKLRAFTPEDWGSIAIRFQGLSSFMGLKELSPENTKAMVDFCRDEFIDFSFTEIQTAFKMNLADKLPDSKGEKTIAYGSFNIDYVGTVLGLYRKYRTLELRKVNKAVVVEKTDIQKKIELDKSMRESFKGMNEYFKSGEASLGTNQAKGYYECLEYFKILPTYTGKQEGVPKELWEKAKQMQMNKLITSSSMVSIENRKMIALIKNPKDTVSDELRKKAVSAVKSNYKLLLVSKCLTDYKDMFDDLEEVKQ